MYVRFLCARKHVSPRNEEKAFNAPGRHCGSCDEDFGVRPLGRDAVWICGRIPAFRRNMLFSSLEMMAVCSSKHWYLTTSPHSEDEHRSWYLQTLPCKHKLFAAIAIYRRINVTYIMRSVYALCANKHKHIFTAFEVLCFCTDFISCFHVQGFAMILVQWIILVHRLIFYSCLNRLVVLLLFSVCRMVMTRTASSRKSSRYIHLLQQ